MDLKTQLGFDADTPTDELIEFANLKLASRGRPIYGDAQDSRFMRMGGPLLASMREKNRLLADFLPPCDQRVQQFLNEILKEVCDGPVPRLPGDTLVLERHGLARTLSLPPDKDHFSSDIIDSYRVKQGVIHNPKNDRRTTKGSFHIAEHGYTIPADKIGVPLVTFARLLEKALNPPSELMRLPFTTNQEDKAELFVSLFMRPMVIPEVQGFTPQKNYEIRFFAPGNLVSNLDFVESIFGNGGDPYLPENDSALDWEHWTGHSGCVILAPHLITSTKKELGLPHVSEATERQKRDGMCWEKEDELYNDGSAFKATLRDKRGMVVTLIADNYFGYCKKEVKTQISFSANLFGLAEEEHAGGAVAYPSYDLGEDFTFENLHLEEPHTYEQVLEILGDSVDVQPEGYAIDKKFPDIYFLPAGTRFDLHSQRITWKDSNGDSKLLKMVPGITYMLPSGYKVEMHKPAEGRRWRLIGTVAEGTFCHKPCTVSGGGKSEISKSIADAILHGPVFTANFRRDFDMVEEIINMSFGHRFKDDKFNRSYNSRPILSERRTLGSVIKLLTPSDEYTEEFNSWLRSIPFYIKDLVLLVKRYYKPDWGSNWRDRFSVDEINGLSGNELKYRDHYIRSHYLRIGYNQNNSWRIFSLRKDFNPASKVQTEDDITASVVVPRDSVEDLDPQFTIPSVKFAQNCEYRLFQRPDEAINRGYDKQTELDYSKDRVFFCNYEPLDQKQASELMGDAIRFSQFTEPMQRTIQKFLEDGTPDYVVSSAHPRVVDGKPTKNPRYLQDRPDVINPRNRYISALGTRLHRRIEMPKQVPMPVNSVLAGRRNNPPDEVAGIRALCVYNPIHFQELPELFMDFVASLTGKSPSTTGAGSEGALTKGPFNALPPVIDLNNALVSYIITGYQCFSSAAGWVGPNCRVDHDISLLVPEIWSRMRAEERDANWLIENEYLDQCKDFEHDGVNVLSSRLGWRINAKFVRVFLGRVFSNPAAVFPADWLKPELQNMDVFIDGVNNIVETQRRIAELYFEDGTVELACPPLKALLHIMAKGDYKGMDVNAPEIRAMFTREALLKSDWYRERLDAKRDADVARWQHAIRCLQSFQEREDYQEEVAKLRIGDRLTYAKKKATEAETEAFREGLVGTLGVDPATIK